MLIASVEFSWHKSLFLNLPSPFLILAVAGGIMSTKRSSMPKYVAFH